MLRTTLLTLCIGVSLVGGASFAQAQPNERLGGSLVPTEPRETLLEVILLTGPDGGALKAQTWRSVFQKLDITLRIRQTVVGEKPEIKETQLGRLRQVTAIGAVDRDGKLNFPDRSFSSADQERLAEWLLELKTYGALGTPSGKPLWGLTQEQFEAFVAQLAGPAGVDLQGRHLDAVVESLNLPTEIDVHWSIAARETLAKLAGNAGKIQQSTEGFTVATSLALALNEYGLGFRPNRTPKGEIELLVDVQREGELWWPVGWPLEQPRPKAVPALFKFAPIIVEDQPLDKVLANVAEIGGIPLLYDLPDLKREGIQPAEIRVSYPRKRQAWMAVLPNLAFQGKLKVTLWQDEAGRPFLWVTTVKSKRALPTEGTRE